MRVIGILKWYSESKGYGFLAVDGLDDVLVHRVLLREAGIASIKEGTTIECEVVQKEKGWQAKQIYRIDESTAQDFPPRQPSAKGGAQPPTPREMILEDEPGAVVAKVKWFSRPKGYGFLTVVGRNEDVFIHTDLLRRFGLRDLTLGQRLLVRLGRGPKGLTAIEVHNLVNEDPEAPSGANDNRKKEEPKIREGVVGDLLFINEARGYGIVVLPDMDDVAHVPLEMLRAAGVNSADQCGKLICDIEFAPTIIVVRRLTRLN
jgi:CspA family cold shock protein